MDSEQQYLIEHMETLHQAIGRAIATRDFVTLLEHTGDMELLAGKAAQYARVTEELQATHIRAKLDWLAAHPGSRCACDRIE